MKVVTQLSKEKETITQLRAVNAHLQSFQLPYYCILSSIHHCNKCEHGTTAMVEFNKCNSLKDTEFTVTLSEVRVIYQVT